MELIDVTTRQTVRLERYDCIGFASGIYAFAFHPAVAEFARQYPAAGKAGVFVDTLRRLPGLRPESCGGDRPGEGCPVLGEFHRKGYDTFGPFRLVGGIAKGRPNIRDLENARRFREVQAGLPGDGPDEVC